MADAEFLQSKAEDFGGEDSFVVGADDLGFAVGTDDFIDARNQ